MKSDSTRVTEASPPRHCDATTPSVFPRIPLRGFSKSSRHHARGGSMGSMERKRQSDEAAANETRSEPFPEGTSIARYKIVSLIGSGAMGDVYRAHDRALNRDIALKVLPPDLTGDRERVRRFAHEARAASALSHPHIVGIHEVGHAKPVIDR